MDTNKDKFVSNIFHDKTSAESAYQSTLNRGYKPEDINVFMSEESRKKYYDSELAQAAQGDKSMEGLALGGALGGTVGGTLGALAAIGTNFIFPGLGLVISGPLVAGLAGAGAGSIAGGLLGTLIGLGIPEDRAKLYEKGIKSGGIVLGIKPRSIEDATALETEWNKYHKKEKDQVI